MSRSRLTGLGNGVIEESMTQDIFGNVTRSTTSMDRNAHAQTRTVDAWDSTINAVTVSAYGLATSSTGKDGLEYTFGYDALGRRISATDPRIGESRTFYDDKGRVESVRDAAGNTTHFYYDDETGRKIADENSLGHVIRYAYNDRGQVVRQWGDATYPVEYIYDAYGRKTAMHTFRAESGWDGEEWPSSTGTADVTTWVYDDATGLLTQKLDAENKGASYTYTVDGKLESRTWARKDFQGNPLVTTYAYDPATGEMLSTDYSDSTPDIAFTYDRLGRRIAVTDGSGSRTFTYNEMLQPESEVISGTATITRAYDSMGRNAGMSTNTGYAVTYGYDEFGRFGNVGWNVNGNSGTAAYGYLADSGLLETVTMQGTGAPTPVASTYQYEPHRNVKTLVTNAYDGTTISEYGYVYDEIGRRTSVTNSGSAFDAPAFSLYGYNSRNELTSAQRYLGTSILDVANPVNKEARRYTFDPIGNRLSAQQDFNISGGGPITSTYATNNLNQYDSVTAGGETIDLDYDDDGNLIQKDGIGYVFNGENRLIEVKPLLPQAGDTKVTFAYDYQGRRYQKTVSTWTGADWSESYTTTYLYNGWNTIEEKKTLAGVDSQTTKAFVWGLDLSQSLQGAGGVGGLLATISNGETDFHLFDANGNVGQLVSASDGSVQAHYEYDPFGRTVKAVGPKAEENTYRFSTKPLDAETGLYYYGYRYLDVVLGRWVNRDPIGEQGGINLYWFVENSPIDLNDILGLEPSGRKKREVSEESVPVYIDMDRIIDRVWSHKGTCEYVSGGEGLGIGIMTCYVYTRCRADHTREVGLLDAWFAGLTEGSTKGVTMFNIQQYIGTGDGPDLMYNEPPKLHDLAGWARISTASIAVVLGKSKTALKLGKTYSDSFSAQAGFDFSLDAFWIGQSKIIDIKVENCCGDIHKNVDGEVVYIKAGKDTGEKI